MSLHQYVPSNQPLAVALRIGPHALFISGCLFAVLSLLASVASGLPIGQLGAGSFALGLAISAGNRLSEKQYLRTMLTVIVAAVIGAIMTGAVPRIGATPATQALTAAYLVWLLIGSMTETGINTDEDPIKEGASAGQSSGMGGDAGGH